MFWLIWSRSLPNDASAESRAGAGVGVGAGLAFIGPMVRATYPFCRQVIRCNPGAARPPPKDRHMNPAKINALLDVMKAACQRQFRFNPRRVAAGVRHMKNKSQRASLTHVFPASHT